MTGPIDPSGLTGMLSEALSALSRAQARPGDPDDQEPPSGTGEGADGLIQVRAVLPGRVEGLRLDPRVMRMNSEDLALEIEAAVNAAFAQLRERSVAEAGVPDLGALNEQLKDLQAGAERQFSQFTASMTEAQAQLARRAGGQ